MWQCCRDCEAANDPSVIAPSVAGLGGIMAAMDPSVHTSASPVQPLPADDPQRTAFDDLLGLASLLSLVFNLTR